MLTMLTWPAARAIGLARARYGRSDPRLVFLRMGPRQLRDIRLVCAGSQSCHLHFANVEAQLGMIR